jgi:hypothetical protein
MTMNLLKRLMRKWLDIRHPDLTIVDKKYQWISALYGKIYSTLWMVFFSNI